MKISTDNGTIRNAIGDIEAIRMISEAGFDGIDYTFYEMVPERDIFELSDDALHGLAQDVNEACAKYGITVPQSHAPYFYKFGESKDAKTYRDVIKSLRFSAEIGCKQVVIHTLKFPRGEMSRQQSDEINREFMLGFLPLAEELDIDIGVENLFQRDVKCRCYYGQHGTPAEIKAFVASIDSPRYKVCCDLGHAAITGTEPEAFIAGMDNKLLTMLHVHDTSYLEDSHTIPYLGRQNWDAITDALAAIDFKGYMNLEVLHFYEHFPVDMLPSALRMAADTAKKLALMVDSKRK